MSAVGVVVVCDEVVVVEKAGEDDVGEVAMCDGASCEGAGVMADGGFKGEFELGEILVGE